MKDEIRVALVINEEPLFTQGVEEKDEIPNYIIGKQVTSGQLTSPRDENIAFDPMAEIKELQEVDEEAEYRTVGTINNSNSMSSPFGSMIGGMLGSRMGNIGRSMGNNAMTSKWRNMFDRSQLIPNSFEDTKERFKKLFADEMKIADEKWKEDNASIDRKKEVSHVLFEKIVTPPFLTYRWVAHYMDIAEKHPNPGKDIESTISNKYIAVAPGMFKNFPEKKGLIQENGLALWVAADYEKITKKVNAYIDDVCDEIYETHYKKLSKDLDNKIIEHYKLLKKTQSFGGLIGLFWKCIKNIF